MPSINSRFKKINSKYHDLPRTQFSTAINQPSLLSNSASGPPQLTKCFKIGGQSPSVINGSTGDGSPGVTPVPVPVPVPSLGLFGEHDAPTSRFIMSIFFNRLLVESSVRISMEPPVRLSETQPPFEELSPFLVGAFLTIKIIQILQVRH